MLIFNENLSVSPLTTHLALKDVHKKITKQMKKHILVNNREYAIYIYDFFNDINHANTVCEILSDFSHILDFDNKIRKTLWILNKLYNRHLYLIEQERWPSG